MTSLAIELPIRVYIEDTDAGGIVFYVNYLKYMERARTELMRSIGIDKAAVFDDALMFVVHDTSVKYKQPAILDDELIVTAALSKVSKVALSFSQQVLRAGELICRGEIKVACANSETKKLAQIPPEYLKKLKARAS